MNMHEAKTHLSRLVHDVRKGAEPEVLIAVGGVPAARLVPYNAPERRLLGIDRGLVTLADDFDAPDAEIAESFEADE